MDPEKNPKDNRPPVIHTMRTDAEMYVKEKKLSSMQLAASSYAAQAPTTNETGGVPASYKMILFGAIVVLCVVVFGGGAWWFLSSKNTNSQPSEIPPPPAILLVDGQNVLTLKQANKISLLGALLSESAKTFRSGIITYYPIKIDLGDNTVYLNAKDFSKLLEWHVPQTLLDNLAPDFNTYIFANKQSNDFVVVMKTNNFEKSFLSMLEWERTLARDWKDFLDSANQTVAFPSAFQDEIIKNNDARLLKKDDGAVIVGYTIFNKKYIVIATSREAIGAVLDRLMTLPPL